MDESHVDHSYDYLIFAVEDYLSKTELERNNAALGDAVLDLETGRQRAQRQKKKGKGKGGEPAVPGAPVVGIGDNCPFWLQGYCKNPEGCRLGQHLPALFGTRQSTPPAFSPGGTQKGADKGKGKTKGKTDKVDKGKSKGRGNASQRSGSGNGDRKGAGGKGAGGKCLLASDALVDEWGRSLCYNYVDGTCTFTADKCRFYHGVPSEAMTRQRIERQEAWQARKEKKDSGGESGNESTGSNKGKAAAKAKAKAKVIAKAKG